MSRGYAVSSPSYVGQHVICDVLLAESISDSDLVDIIQSGLELSNMTIVEHCKKDFEPQGMTAFWILAESHFSIHTYPESHYITMDCYTCGQEGNPEKAMLKIVESLSIRRYSINTINRGHLSNEQTS